MTRPSIAFIGRAGSGKDTAAEHLISRHAYTRVAFADPLRVAALAANPIVGSEPGHYGYLPTRLRDVVERYGWERAKRDMPEVRRTLQGFGQAVRDLDPDFWLGLALDRIAVAELWSLPVVVTDCRYLNEANALRANGFKLVRVARPGLREPSGEQHVSETELDGFAADAELINDGSPAQLAARTDVLVDQLS